LSRSGVPLGEIDGFAEREEMNEGSGTRGMKALQVVLCARRAGRGKK